MNRISKASNQSSWMEVKIEGLRKENKRINKKKNKWDIEREKGTGRPLKREDSRYALLSMFASGLMYDGRRKNPFKVNASLFARLFHSSTLSSVSFYPLYCNLNSRSLLLLILLSASASLHSFQFQFTHATNLQASHDSPPCIFSVH